MAIFIRGIKRYPLLYPNTRYISMLSSNFEPAKAGTTKIGWIGTGVMGKSMVSHIMDAGFECYVYNRTASKASDLVSKGAILVDSPAELARNVDIVFSIVGYPSDVANVMLNPDSGVLSSMKEGGIIVDMTTSEPSLAQKIAEQAKIKGISSLDAPVSGGDIGARDAKLSIMVGGEQAAYDKVLPLFHLMGKNVKLMGGAGNGQHTKMVNQILIANNMIGVCEGLLYAHKAGLDISDTIATVGAGAAGSFSINVLGPRIAKNDFDPGFFVDHFIKDLGIALEEARKMKISLPGLALANQMYIALSAQGHGQKGTQALILALEQLSGIHRHV